MDAYINGKKIRLTPSQSIGKGGEADVYRIDDDTVVKIFKQPDHPDYANSSQEAEGAKHRIKEHQTKLRQFPALDKNLNVMAPAALAMNHAGEIVGYTMPFIKKAEVLMRWSERSFRGATLDNNKVLEMFQNLRDTVDKLHTGYKIVIGDFNDLNVLVTGQNVPILIDADSFQFGKFLCRMFTERFVDPLHCDPKENRPILKVPHNEASDWYAWNVMLFRSLLLCDPFGGIYRPKNKNQQIPHTARPLPGYRISVFHKDVIYPKPAVPYDRLPDGLLDWFHQVFQGPQREVSKHLLSNVRWTACTGCGTEHARPVCPSCQKAAPAAIKEVTKVRGKVTSTMVFRIPKGEIVFATYQNGLKWVFDGAKPGPVYYREDDRDVYEAAEKGNRIRIKGDFTLFGRDGMVSIMLNEDGKDPVQFAVDSYGTLPVFDANEQLHFWCWDGILYREGALGPKRIGDVLKDQTLFWVGPTFGFGFYRAAELSVAFVFEAESGGLNDGVQLPPLRGHLLDSTAVFGKDLCWFFASLKQGSRIVNRVTVIRRDGTIEGHLEEESAPDSWMHEIRGKVAVGKYLFSVTDEGLVRLEVSNGKVVKTAEFPDAEPFVHAGCHLFPAANGLHVVDRNEIRLLKMG